MRTISSESQSHIRRAIPDEAQQLGALAVRSKAYWGYAAEFMAACRPLLMPSPDYIAAHPVFVLAAQAGIIGWYSLLGAQEQVELDHLFVDPSAIGQGYGRLLFTHAVATAAQLGFQRLIIESDPNAEPFYRAMGAERVGERLSPLDTQRRLPLLSLALAPTQA